MRFREELEHRILLLYVISYTTANKYNKEGLLDYADFKISLTLEHESYFMIETVMNNKDFKVLITIDYD